jgi:hypothetical protein
MTGTNCDLFTHNQSRSYLNHLVCVYIYIIVLSPTRSGTSNVPSSGRISVSVNIQCTSQVIHNTLSCVALHLVYSLLFVKLFGG